MSEKINKKFLFYILIFISVMLISAYVMEYKFNFIPCKLCLYERVPYFLAIFLIIQILLFERYEKLTLFLIFLTFFFSAILGFYHFGIEQGFFEEPLTCKAGNLAETLTKDELLEQLKQNTISCKEVSFKIIGFSLAAINTIFSIILSVIFLKQFLNYGKNR